METDFVSFASMAGIMIFPLAMIYLILSTAGWNKRKSLFWDGWFVYLGWLLSGFITFLAWALADVKFRMHNIPSFLPMIGLSIVIIQTIAVAGVLYWRSRIKAISLTYLNESVSESTPARKILGTAFLVSVLTFMLAARFIIALQDMEDKLSPKIEDRNNSGISFKLYD